MSVWGVWVFDFFGEGLVGKGGAGKLGRGMNGRWRVWNIRVEDVLWDEDVEAVVIRVQCMKRAIPLAECGCGVRGGWGGGGFRWA